MAGSPNGDALAYHPGPAAGLNAGSQGFIFTADIHNANCGRYDIERNTWALSGFAAGAIPPFPTYQTNVSIVAANGVLYAYGGSGNRSADNSPTGGVSFWKYEPNVYSGTPLNPNYPNGRYLGKWTELTTATVPA